MLRRKILPEREEHTSFIYHKMFPTDTRAYLKRMQEKEGLSSIICRKNDYLSSLLASNRVSNNSSHVFQYTKSAISLLKKEKELSRILYSKEFATGIFEFSTCLCIPFQTREGRALLKKRLGIAEDLKGTEVDFTYLVKVFTIAANLEWDNYLKRAEYYKVGECNDGTIVKVIYMFGVYPPFSINSLAEGIKKCEDLKSSIYRMSNNIIKSENDLYIFHRSLTESELQHYIDVLERDKKELVMPSVEETSAEDILDLRKATFK